MSPVPIERDHDRLRRERDAAPSHLGQRQCPNCWAWYLLTASLARHVAREYRERVARIPAVVADAAAKQIAYEAAQRARRGEHRFITRDELAVLEGRH